MTADNGTPTAEQEKESTKPSPWWKRLWEWTEFGKKSGWQYLQLLSALALPVVLAIAVYWFTTQQEAIEEQRAQEATLQAYLDQMSSLMIGDDPLKLVIRTGKSASNRSTLSKSVPLRLMMGPLSATLCISPASAKNCKTVALRLVSNLLSTVKVLA